LAASAPDQYPSQLAKTSAALGAALAAGDTDEVIQNVTAFAKLLRSLCSKLLAILFAEREERHDAGTK
jgi:hypothetical protein